MLQPGVRRRPEGGQGMSYYTDGTSDCWPDRTIGEALSDGEPNPTGDTLSDLNDQEDALALFWWDMEAEDQGYPYLNPSGSE